MIEFDGRMRASWSTRCFRPRLSVRLDSLEAAPVGVDYDPLSLEPVAASSTAIAGSRIQIDVRHDPDHGPPRCAPLFARRLSAVIPTLRWQAMREFLALDASLPCPSRAMAGADPHPEVRSAAAATLAAFFPDSNEGLAPCPS